MTILRALAFTIALLVPLAARAGDPAAPHIAKAMEAHKAGRFADALAELQTAYKLDPRPELLFALGQVNVKLERCPDAVTYYEQYLGTNPSPQATADTRQAIETCKTKMTSAPAAAPAASPSSGGGAPAQDGAPPPFYKDKLGDAFVIGGVAVTVIGVALYASARSDLDDADHAMTLPQYDDLVDSAHSKRTWSVLLVGGGVALAGAGIVHFMLHGQSKETRGVGMVPAQGGGLVTWAGQF